MNNRLLASCAAVAALCAGAVSVADAEEGIYFSLTGGMSMFDLSRNDLDRDFGGALQASLADGGLDTLDYVSSLDDSDSSWAAQVGYQFSPYLAVEGGYITFGESTYDANIAVTDGFDVAALNLPLRFRSGGFTAAAVGILPLGERAELHGRGGVLFARNRVRQRINDYFTGETLDSIEFRGNSVDPFVGVGASWIVNTRLAVSLDYQRYLDVGDDEDTPEFNIDVLALTVQFR